MATGRIRRSARRGVAAAVLAWLGVAAASVLAAPPASAASSYIVHIRDLTPPVASVDKNGTVRFINEIPNKTVQVGGGGIIPSVVSVNAKTQVVLTLPSGDHPLEPTLDPLHPDSTSAWDEVFPATCVTCKITYKYELSSGSSMTQAISDAAIKLLPPLPLPTPFVVNTLLPLPNVPGVNLPKLPPITVPGSITGLLPQLPVPTVPTLPNGGTVLPTAPSGVPTIAGIPGNIYAYLTAGGAPQMAPAGAIAAPGFVSSRYFGTTAGSSGSGGGKSGSAGPGGNSAGGNSAGGNSAGGNSAGNPGVSVPVYPQQGTVDLNTDSAQRPAPIGGGTFPAIALAAVLLLGAVTVGLVRTFRAARSAA